MTSARSTRTFSRPTKRSRSAGRDLPAREDAGSNLVEQRLEQVVVDAVDQRDVNVALRARRSRDLETAEAAADDDDAPASGRFYGFGWRSCCDLQIIAAIGHEPSRR